MRKVTYDISSPLIHFVVSCDCLSGQWRPRSDCVIMKFDIGAFAGRICPETYFGMTRPYFKSKCFPASDKPIGPRRAEMLPRANANSEGPDRPAHARSLIKIFIVRLQNHWILHNVWMQNEGLDDALRMRKMIWIGAFCTFSKALFRLARPN